LSRVDGAGVLRAGEFSLSPLAVAIIDHYVNGETLTRESPNLLTRTLAMSLSQLVAAARQATAPEQWRDEVAARPPGPVTDLIASIESRQRGLDLEQEAFQKRIASLLNTDWFGALEQCQELLDAPSRTLAELNEMLIRGSQELSALLQELLTLSIAASSEE